MATEPFPPMYPLAHVRSKPNSQTDPNASNVRRRRQSSSLGADPRGDTGARALATSNLKQSTPPRTLEHTHNGKERKRRKARRYLSRFKRLCLKHTWLIPLLLASTILALYALSPGEHNPLHPAIFLSYPNPPLHERTTTLPAHIGNVTQYGKGRKDFAFVAFYTIVLSFTREFLMQRLIRPLAVWFGIRGRGKMARFMEQFYTAIYFAIFGPFGMYVMSRTPVWYFNTAGMYQGFPHRAHEGVFKAYYLLQASYWAQQGLVLMLQLEKPRKDFRELVLHHIITLALIGLSYRFHFTYMGVAVYITHDISDFFLATSKILNYLDAWITPPYFVTFMAIWAYLRHFINLRILYSLSPYALPFLTTPPNEFATVGPFTLNWETQQYKCWISQAITFALLAALQAVNAFWFFLIVRILVRIVWKGVVKDERSDDEEEEMEEDEREGEVVVEEPVKKVGNGKVKGPQVVLNGEPLVEERLERELNGSVGGVVTGRENGGGRKGAARRKR
ncbi:sphingosine N-acyltransferase lag1 [Saxophila tyrrhenica]|uniref:Sphingosine N-acyltransferase lag1 n=1 Tax=Saxophila tyrrhenica TaxID=1690608 RepID=A0AAV9P4W8_9PEZI|nr:sphingosine N-acyltransferase lag1 [Saxophila tyrrhenica]